MQDLKSEKRVYTYFLVKLLGLLTLIFLFVRYLGSLTGIYTRGFDFQVQRYQREIISSENKNEKKRNIIALGDSTAARNILFPKESYALSLSTFGGSLVDGYYLLHRYLQNHSPPKCVVIATSYGAFDSHIKEYFWPALVQNGFYSLNELMELYLVGKSQNDFPGTMSPFEYGYKVLTMYDWHNGFEWKSLQNYLFSSSNSWNKNSQIYWSAKNNNGFIPVSREMAKQHNFPFTTPSEEHLKDKFYPRKTLDIYIQRLFKMLDELKIRTIIIHTPIAKSLQTQSSEKWLEDYKQHLSSLIGNYSKIENHIEATWMDDDNYYDGLHFFNFAAIEYTQNKKSLFESCR